LGKKAIPRNRSPILSFIKVAQSTPHLCCPLFR
jgi:hypothetical protein